MARERGLPVAVSIHPKPVIIIIIFIETHYQTYPANTETHHQTHRNKSPNPSEKITTDEPISNHPNATQILPKRRKPMNKPTPKTHKQTHDLHASTTAFLIEPPRRCLHSVEDERAGRRESRKKERER